jgi:hypothetical protein
MLKNSIGGFVLNPPEADKIGFVWVRFDQVSNVHFSL